MPASTAVLSTPSEQQKNHSEVFEEHFLNIILKASSCEVSGSFASECQHLCYFTTWLPKQELPIMLYYTVILLGMQSCFQ